MSSITFTDVSKRFDDTVAVDDLTLHVADGEFLVLLGPSGCGKSTVLRMLAGLETPTTGTISIGEQVVNDIDARHRDVAMVFQSYALYPHMTVAKNIESPLIGRRSERTSREARAQQVMQAADMLGLTDLLDRKPGQLSGGQRQRVAVARAIVRKPAVFLMDEPLSNLDAKLRTETRAELVDLHAQLGATFVYVTHDQVEAMTMASRIAVLENGRLQQLANPRTLYDEPANVFIARFIGSPPMNIVRGRVNSNGNESPSLEVSGRRVSLGDGWGRLIDGDNIDMGIRPEDVRFAASGVPATVVAREWLGHEQIVEVDIDGTRVSVRDNDEALDVRPGGSVHVTADSDDIHLFDVESGLRVARSSE